MVRERSRGQVGQTSSIQEPQGPREPQVWPRAASRSLGSGIARGHWEAPSSTRTWTWTGCFKALRLDYQHYAADWVAARQALRPDYRHYAADWVTARAGLY